MGDIPLDAQRVVDELRTSRRKVAADAPRWWTPPGSFDSAVTRLSRTPAHLNENLAWMHKNWGLGHKLVLPPERGLKGLMKRIVNPVVRAALGPYLEGLQNYLVVSLRALDGVARRSDEDFTAQQSQIDALRSDLVDLARHVDERANG